MIRVVEVRARHWVPKGEEPNPLLNEIRLYKQKDAYGLRPGVSSLKKTVSIVACSYGRFDQGYGGRG